MITDAQKAYQAGGLQREQLAKQMIEAANISSKAFYRMVGGEPEGRKDFIKSREEFDRITRGLTQRQINFLVKKYG